nr:MAG TPA: hypothetical protein [Microviridae sp.]
MPPLEVTTIINPLKFLQLCRNLLFQLKKKPLAVIAPVRSYNYY